MKTVHINTYCTGGAAKACRRIVGALNKAGTESKMLVLYKTNEDIDTIDVRDGLSTFENYRLKIANKLNVLRHGFEFENREELFSTYHTAWNVSTHTLIKSADVVHLHWVSGFINFPSFFDSGKKKIVFTLHDHFPFSGGAHYPNPLFESEKFKEATVENLKLLKILYPKNNVHFVGPSQYIIDHFVKTLGTGFKTSVIKNPVDSNVFLPKDTSELRTKFGFKPDDKILMFVNEKEGYKRKGSDVFINMLPEILKIGYKVLFLGEKTTRINDPRVIQTGYINSDEKLNEYYNVADLFVCTSLDDNLPNVISESHCAGTPVIAFSTGGIPEMIEEGKNGYLIPKFDEKLYLDKLREFSRAVFNKEEISSKAHEVYSEATAAKKYNDIYLNG